MIKINSNRQILKYSLLITILYILNSIIPYSNAIGIVIGISQVIFLIYLLVFKGIQSYFIYLLMFLTTTIEVSSFALQDSELYNFLRLPYIYGKHIQVLIVIPIIYFIIKSKKSDFKKIKSLKNTKIILYMFFTMLILGIFTMLICAITADNNMFYNEKKYIYFNFVESDFLRFLSLLLITLYTILLLIKDSEFFDNIKNLIISSIISILPAAIFTIIMNIYGNYAGRPTLMLPLISFFAILIGVFPFYNKFKNNISYFLISAAIIFIMVKIAPNPLGGKWWFIVIYVALFFIYRLIMSINIRDIIFFVSTIVILIIGGYILTNNEKTINEINSLTKEKLEQATSMLKVWEEDWYYNIPDSPKFRIDEFINVSYEYKNKPQFFLTGKGFGGSTKQYTDDLNWNQEGAFSIAEIENSVYFNLHETLNVLYLKFGLVGLIYMTLILYISIKNINKNPFIIVGLIWFLFYLNIYTSLYLCLCSLIIGFYSIDNEKMQISKT